MKPIAYQKITVIEPETPDERAVVHAGDMVVNLRMLQESIDGRRNNTLSWSHLITSIEAATKINGQPMSKGQMSKKLRPKLEKRLGRGLTNIEQAKLGGKYPSPVEGFAATISDYFNLDKAAPLLHPILAETEARSLGNGANIGAQGNAVSAARKSLGAEFDAASITTEEQAIKSWKDFIFNEVIPRAREKEPKLYSADRTDAQVWAMLVNTVCNQQHDKDSPFAEIEFNSEDKAMLWDMLPIEHFSAVLAAHLGIEGSALDKKLRFCEKIGIYGFEMDKDGLPYAVANDRDRAFEAQQTMPSTRAMTEGATFVLSGPALTPGEPPSAHQQAHQAGRAVEMGDDRYDAILDIIGKARRQKGWKHLTDPALDACEHGHDEGRVR